MINIYIHVLWSHDKNLSAFNVFNFKMFCDKHQILCLRDVFFSSLYFTCTLFARLQVIGFIKLLILSEYAIILINLF